MNEEVNKILAEILQKALTAAEKTGQFVIDQAPDVLQQFYKWHIALNLLQILLFLFLFLLTYNLYRLWSFKELNESMDKKNYVKIKSRWYHIDSLGDPSGYTAKMFVQIFSYFWLIGVANAIYYLVFIAIAPKLFLIEYFLGK